MLLTDYHVHSDISFDCNTSMMDMCQHAVEIGLAEIAFTDHFNNHQLDIDLGFYNPDRYFEDIYYCRAQFPSLMILAGIEVGEPHRWSNRITPILERYPYDIVIGSLHWVGQINMFNSDYFRTCAPEQAFGDYFEELIQMIKYGGFDILAHVDLPKRLGFDVYGEFDICLYEDSVRGVWQACLDNNITPEINTKALRLPVNQLHPPVEALRWYVEMGGECLTIGSDAHRPDSISSGFGAARECALYVGLTHTCRSLGRQIVGWNAL